MDSAASRKDGNAGALKGGVGYLGETVMDDQGVEEPFAPVDRGKAGLA